MGFESIANSINSYLQVVADTNNYTIRFDNDPRTTPTETLWLESSIKFGDSQQIELGINSHRNFGDLIITIKNGIDLGIGGLLEVADIIGAAFKSVDIDTIVFRVPSIKNNGRVNDNWEVEITCPFYIDEN